MTKDKLQLNADKVQVNRINKNKILPLATTPVRRNSFPKFFEL